MPVSVANGDEDNAAGALAGSGLLLNGHDLHDLVAKTAAEESINNLVLLQRERVVVDLLLVACDISLLARRPSLVTGTRSSSSSRRPRSLRSRYPRPRPNPCPNPVRSPPPCCMVFDEQGLHLVGFSEG